jgi:hypothetical protein
LARRILTGARESGGKYGAEREIAGAAEEIFGCA